MTPIALVVDDEADVRELAGIVLDRAGFRVRMATNGRHALDTLAGSSAVPDLIVLDVQMPELDGWDTLAAIRSDRRTADVPVILCTVRGQPSDAQRAWKLGCDGFLRKPFGIDELANEALDVTGRTPADRLEVRRTQLAAARPRQ